MPIPVTNEARTYSHPAPTSNTFFGFAVDASSKYVGVLSGRSGANRYATEFDAIIYDAATGKYLRTLSQPVPADDDNFRFASIAIDGDVVVIGATYAHVPLPGGGIAYNAGAAYVYDLTTGQLRFKLVSNTPQDNFLLGTSVAISGNRIAVGSWGNAYVFDATSGTQLAHLTSPTPADNYGYSVAISDAAIVVGGDADPQPGSYSEAAYAYDPQTFSQMSKFIPSNAPAGAEFGNNLAIDGHYAIGSSGAGAYVFDVLSGKQLQALTLPGSTYYPDAVDIQGTSVLLGNAALDRGMTFDWTTGKVLQDLVPSDFSSTLQFGYSVALAGKSAFVAPLPLDTGASSTAKVYEFRVVSEPSTIALLLVGLIATQVLTRARSRITLATQGTILDIAANREPSRGHACLRRLLASKSQSAGMHPKRHRRIEVDRTEFHPAKVIAPHQLSVCGIWPQRFN